MDQFRGFSDYVSRDNCMLLSLLTSMVLFIQLLDNRRPDKNGTVPQEVENRCEMRHLSLLSA
jgi:hypothetical protein